MQSHIHRYADTLNIQCAGAQKTEPAHSYVSEENIRERLVSKFFPLIADEIVVYFYFHVSLKYYMYAMPKSSQTKSI